MFYEFQMREFITTETSSQTHDDEEPSLYISNETFEKFSLISGIIITPIICVLGIIGNTIGLALLCKTSRIGRLSFHNYMLALLTIHLMTLLVGLVRWIPAMIKTRDRYLGNYTEEHMRVLCVYIDFVLLHISSFILITMSVERLLSLVRPFTFKAFCPTRHPRMTIFVCTMISITYLFPFALFFTVDSSLNADNQTEFFMTVKDNWKEEMNSMLYVETTIIHFVCPAAVLVLNIAIPAVFYQSLKTNAVYFRYETARGKQLKKMTGIVLSITGTYFLLSLPNMSAHILTMTSDQYKFNGQHRNVFYLFIGLGNIFFYLNAGGAAVIYILSSRRGWSVVKRTFHTMSSARRNFQSSTSCQSSQICQEM